MAAGGDVIELVHEQSYLGQTINNIYFFEAAVADASLSGLATWFETNVVAKVKAAQLADVSHINLRLRNLFNLAETHEEPLAGTGSIVSGTAELPSFMAATIRLDHIEATVRPGFKRFCGSYEGWLENAIWHVDYVTALTTIAGELVNPPATANAQWAHVIVGRICETPNPDPTAIPSCLKYRLPETQAEKEVGYPVAFEVYTQPTTQNSRKYYT